MIILLAFIWIICGSIVVGIAAPAIIDPKMDSKYGPIVRVLAYAIVLGIVFFTWPVWVGVAIYYRLTY